MKSEAVGALPRAAADGPEPRRLGMPLIRHVNPYIAGNSVGGSPAFVGRAELLREVLRMLSRPTENALVLFGQRRIGKTSLLMQLAAELPAQGSYRPVYLDLQDKAALPLDRVLLDLQVLITQGLGLDPMTPGADADTPRAFREEFIPRAIDQLEPGGSLVLLIDEFDVLDNPAEGQAGASFFPYLRELLGLSPARLKFVFVIGRRREDLSSLTLSVFKGIKSCHVSLLSAEEVER